jgi:hypothetical protein
MLINKDNGGKTIGWRETYFGSNETVNVSVVRNITTIATRDKTNGKVESKTFLGTPLLPSKVSDSK